MNQDFKTWTEADFETMNWHDCAIYAIGFVEDKEHFENQVYLDIDYIIEWRQTTESTYFDFLVCPCTLVFNDVHNLRIDIDTGMLTILDITIENIHLLKEKISNGYATSEWHIELRNGDIFLEAVGYKQVQRSESILTKQQRLTLAQRNGISLVM